MDTTVFTLKREEIQQRMATRRLQAIAAHEANPPRILPWLISTGLGLATGIRATRKSYGWMGTLAGALVLPSVLKFLGHKNGDSDSVWHRLARAVFPTLSI